MKKSVLKYLLSFSFIVFILSSCGIEARLQKAEKHYALGEYATAGSLYRSVYSRIPSEKREKRANIAFKQGECYRLINYYRAEQVYLNAIRNKYANDTVYLRLGQVQMRNGHYADAAKSFNTFLRTHPDSELAQNGWKSGTYALELQKNPTRHVVKLAKDFNNSSSSSFSPAFMGTDADVLYITSNRRFGKKNVVRKNNGVSGQPNNHIFSTKKDAKGKWGKIEIVEGEINTGNDEGVTSFTADGRSMYFTRSNTVADRGNGTMIMVSNRAGGAWSAPQPLKLFKDSAISVAHPAISPDGETLYFVSDNPEGLGGKDLWKAVKVSGEWGAIQNLGAQINTQGDEMFPVVRTDGTLYFSSDGHPGMGGLDIFQAKEMKDGKWEVKNLGAPINSFNDDFGITFEGKNERGYLSSNRATTRAYDALWSFELPELEYILTGKITDRQGDNVPDARIKIVSNNGENVRIQAKGDGTYRFKMKRGEEYVMMASARGYLNQKSQLNTYEASAKKSEDFKIDFQLTPISKPVRMNNIFYDFGKWTLTPESETGLQALVKLLTDNPNITIELSSHTDYVGNNESNRVLSERRAQSVVDYLIKAGIDKRRLTPVGYGEEQPFTVDAATVKKHSFLKLNTPLTEEYILTLSPAEQEIANQINRRTEFKVLKTTYNMY